MARTPPEAKTKSLELPHPPRLYKLLTQVAKYYQRRFKEEPRARDYLAERGITDKQALEVFGAGYCDGTLKDILPFDGEVHADLKTLGIIKDNGKEFFAECVVFPLWSSSGVCVGMYGRRLFASEVKHLYLPGPRRGLINWQAAKRAADSASELVFAEAVIDALSLYVAGATDVVPCYGTGGFTQDHAELLRRFAPKHVAICFDGDEPGRTAAAKLADELLSAAKGKTTVRVITLAADADANGILVEQGPEALRHAVELPPATPFAAMPAPLPVEESSQPVAGASKPAFERPGQGLAMHVEGRVYEVKASVRQGTQLRATLKAHKAGEPTLFELATIDLYSHRSREWFAGLCAALFGIEAAKATTDLCALMSKIEQELGEKQVASEKPRIELTDRERDEALALLRRPDLMQQVLEAFEHLGYTDEIINKQLGYLVATSRKLDKPLSLLIESRSSAGKSALQDAILAFVPEEEFLKYNRITDQALFYQAEDALDHKLLVIEEATGMGGAAYSIRALQSGEEIRVASTNKDPMTGKMRTEEYTVKARTSVMMTTTNPTFDEETKNRFIRATVNESAELTKRILEMQRWAQTLEGIALKRRAERLKTLHRNAQRLLSRVTVINPYAPKLSFPTASLLARRDNIKYLNLINAVTLLHQYQREKKTETLYGETIEHIVTTVEDIAMANRIAAEVMVPRKSDATPQAVQLMGLARKMLMNGGGKDNGEVAFTRRRLREYTGWSDWQVRTHLGELAELEYLRVRQGAFGKEYVYELSDTHLLEALPGFGRSDPEELRATLANAPAPRAPQQRPRLNHRPMAAIVAPKPACVGVQP